MAILKKSVDIDRKKRDTINRYLSRRNKMKERVKEIDVIEAIKRAFRENLEVDEIELSNYNKGKSPFEYGYSFEGDRAKNRESEWLVFTSEDNAYKEAYEMVKDDLQSEPEIFNQDWLSDFIYITETDRRLIAGEESQWYVDDMSNEEILEEADMIDEYNDLQEEINNLEEEIETLDNEIQEAEDNITMSNLTDQINDAQLTMDKKTSEQEDLIEKAKEDIREQRYDYIYDALEDPIEYFVEEQGIYVLSDLLQQSFITIDVDKASKSALDFDGVDHFLDGYDGKVEEITDPETGDKFYVYGTN